MGFYYHTWETTKQNVTLWGTLLYFLLHINMTRIQIWKKKKSVLLTNKTFKILSKALLSLFFCIYWIKSTTFISSCAYYNYFKLNMVFFKHCIKQNLPELRFSMPICSTKYEKYNATMVPFLCSLPEQHFLCIHHVTEKVTGIFTAPDTQLCQNLYRGLYTMQKSALYPWKGFNSI